MASAQNSPYLRPIGRRGMLKGFGVAAGLIAVPGALAACGSSSSKPGNPAAATGTVTIGSNGSDPVPKAAFAALFAAGQTATGLTTKINTVDHNTFQTNISTYLQGTPDDVFTWFAGNRMQYFAAQGLLSPLDDVWQVIGANFSDAMKAQSKGADGKYYFVPDYYYPWGLFYSKATWAAKGYTVPTTWDDFIALCKKMKADGLIPLGFADKDQWPAYGTFDFINMRTNGYDFHIGLMQGKESWTDPKVKATFTNWAQLFPYYSPGANGRTWQEGVNLVLGGQAGMIVQGLDQAGPIFQAAGKTADLDFFEFPAIDPSFGQDAIEAPIDGWMSPKSPKNKNGATKVLEWLGTAPAQLTYLKSSPNDIAAANGGDTSGYDALQTKSASLIASKKQISQFMDRDANPTFVTTVMATSIQKFIDDQSGIDSLLNSIQNQAKTIYSGG